jgi:hypothetical protein
MKSDRKNPPVSVVNGLFLLTLVMLGYTGAIGFGTVWLRHQISVSANESKQLEQQIADLQRRLSETSAEIAVARSPEQLIRQNELLGLNLVRPTEEQVVRATGDVERRLAEKRFDQLFSSADPAAPVARQR